LEIAASTPHAANKYSKTLSRLANERVELTRELERIDEHCAALETGRAGADDARGRAEQLARAKAMRMTKQEALATTLRQIRLTATLSERFEEQNRRAFRRIEQSAHERAMRDVEADVSTTTTTTTTTSIAVADEPAAGTRAIEREYAHREQMIQMGVITPFENTKLSKMRTKMISQRENSGLQWHEPALKPTALLVATNNKKKRKMPVSSEDVAQRVSNNFDDDEDDDYDAQDFVAAADVDVPEPAKRGRGRPRKDAAVTPVATDSTVWSDDGDQRRYCERLAAWWDEHADEIRARVPPADDDDDDVVVRRPRTLAGLIEAVAKFYAEAPSVDFDGGLRLPQTIHDRLFPYQRTAVRWLWELHCQDAGGIVGDEMGLGKTVTCSTFLAALHASGLLQRPVLIACPATVLAQWTRELHRWYPPLRVMMMHSSGSGGASVKRLLRAVQVPSVAGCVLLTTYDAIRRHGELLQQCEWSYVILDEGHKIRNPNAAVTLACKALDTPHRVILSGAPIQNNLTELWSLFDFVFPGKLGTLPVFQSEFEVPIRLGGFANASAFRVQTAYKCAVALRDLIRPYLLRRLKKDVMTDLPEKTEQVLFCRLTETQLKAYRSFISSEQTSSILEGQLNMLYGVDALRKICNHPDLLEHRERAGELGLDRKRPRVSRAINGDDDDDDDDSCC
jgi:hypothetical protein